MLPTTIATELKLRPHQVAAAIELLDEGATVPFIARYRKEATGGLDEEQLRQIEARVDYLRKLEARKSAVRAEIESQDKLTPDLDAELRAATTLQQVEDLYRPYKPKRRTRAAVARELGLEPLAEALLAQDKRSDPQQLAERFINDDVPDAEAALAGARDIIAEQVSDNAVVRQLARQRTHDRGFIVSKLAAEDADPEGRYRVYHEFRAPLQGHRPAPVAGVAAW